MLELSAKEQSVQLSKLVQVPFGVISIVDGGTIQAFKMHDMLADVVISRHGTLLNISEATHTTTSRRHLPPEGRGKTHWTICNLRTPCPFHEHLVRKVGRTSTVDIINVREVGTDTFVVMFKMRIRR